MKNDISVVVTTMNSADTIINCLTGLINQDNLKAEIIIVDYQSSDNTLELIKNFLHENRKKYKLINQKNPGLGTARNIGLSHATSDYIAFLDSDDYLHDQAYRKMIDFAEENFLDFVICRADTFDDYDGLLDDYFYDDYQFNCLLGNNNSAIGNFRGWPILFSLEPNACRKIYNRQFLIKEHISFPDEVRAEDLLQHYKCITSAYRIGLIRERLFFYRVNRTGKLTNDPSSWINDLIYSNQVALAHVGEKGLDDFSGACVLYLMVRSLVGYCSMINNPSMRKNLFERLALLFEQINPNWIRTYKNLEFGANDIHYKLTFFLLLEKKFDLVEHLIKIKKIYYKRFNFGIGIRILIELSKIITIKRALVLLISNYSRRVF